MERKGSKFVFCAKRGREERRVTDVQHSIARYSAVIDFLKNNGRQMLGHYEPELFQVFRGPSITEPFKTPHTRREETRRRMKVLVAFDESVSCFLSLMTMF